MHFSSSPFRAHVLPIFSFDRLNKGLVKNGNYKAPHYVIFSILLPHKTPDTIMFQCERKSKSKENFSLLQK
jgi:hypothetical protein